MREPADPTLLARIQAEEVVATTPDASIGAWLGDVGRALVQALEDWARDAFGAQVSEASLWLAVTVLVAILAATALATTLTLRRRRRTRWRLRGTAAPRKGDPTPRPSAAPHPRDQVAALLASGRPREALGALWRWLAQELSDRGLGRWAPDRTEREFLATLPGDWAGAAAVRRVAAGVVRGVYGAAPPAAEEVRHLAAMVEELLASPSGAEP